MRTAVWMVIWSDPEILAPLSGCDGPYSFLMAMSPGIYTSARSISLRPQLARLISFTLDAFDISTVLIIAKITIAVDINSILSEYFNRILHTLTKIPFGKYFLFLFRSCTYQGNV